MRALVTGVTGQDGWYLTELLLEQGHAVFGVVKRDDLAQCPPGIQALDGDMLDAASLRAALDVADPDEVYNLASISSVARSWREPDVVADVNGVGAVRLFAAVHERAARTGRSARVVQAGSAEIFGAAPAPQSERTPVAPSTPYGAAKALAHHMAAVYRSAGLHVSSLILFNHESPRRPDTFVTRKITSVVAAIAAGRQVRLPLGDLDRRRDWGFAGDYVRAMTLAARATEPDDYVIATGVSHTVADFAGKAFAHVGITDWRAHVDLDTSLARTGDAPEQRGDASHARQTLGWRPQVGFDELVARMVDADRDLLDR